MVAPDLSQYIESSSILTPGSVAQEQVATETAADITREQTENRTASYLVDDDTLPQSIRYNSFAGVDVTADLVLPGEGYITLGELQTFSYSMHRKNSPARVLGHVMPVGFAKGGRTVGGSMIFTVFNRYAFYRLKHFQDGLNKGLFPLADMLPPFDMNITFANEFGVLSSLRLFGVTLIDEGTTMSIDDLIVESVFSYMARGIQPMIGHVMPTHSQIADFAGGDE